MGDVWHQHRGRHDVLCLGEREARAEGKWHRFVAATSRRREGKTTLSRRIHRSLAFSPSVYSLTLNDFKLRKISKNERNKKIENCNLNTNTSTSHTQGGGPRGMATHVGPRKGGLPPLSSRIGRRKMKHPGRKTYPHTLHTLTLHAHTHFILSFLHSHFHS